MSTPVANPNVKYVAEIKNVREVSLHGTAELEFWKEHLRPEGLFPWNSDGKARLLITAIDARWMGVPFREFTIALQICLIEESAQPDGLYLVHAFHSLRLFAFVERASFKTPYYHADVRVQSEIPASIYARRGEANLLKAEMAIGMHPVETEDDNWVGSIYLPARMGRTGSKGNFFHARLEGESVVYTFDPERDVVELGVSESDPVIQWLADSNFTASEWHIKNCATHARSKTFQRDSREASVG